MKRLAITFGSLALLSATPVLAADTVQTTFAEPATGPSCDGKPGAANDCQGESCCLRIHVPGGTFGYRNDQVNEQRPVSVKSFYLDKYETTVGRFRAWVAAGSPMPEVGTVLQQDLNGDPVLWTDISRFSVQRGERLKGWDKYDTWSANMSRAPKNNINWYTAAAFCHWDGGRLPTEHEWQYTAVGGSEGRLHPWGDARPTFDHAVYNCHGDGHGSCDIGDLLPVGSKPKGGGRWGHMDLAGSLFEWTVAYNGGKHHAETGKSRGGGFCYIGGVDRRAPEGLKATTARLDKLDTLSHTVGVRCAYDGAASKPDDA